MKIGFFELEGWEQKIILRALETHEVYLSKSRLASDSLPGDSSLEAVSVFVESQIDRAVLDHFPHLRFIATRSTGYEHIDLDECTRRNIIVSHVPAYGDNTVAEFTFGLLLNLTRKIYAAVDQVKETGSFALAGLRGTDLLGRAIGVIGTGRIGKEMIRIAHGFGMRILAYDIAPDTQFAQETGFEYRSFEDLLHNADIITIHCPLTPETRHLINKGNVFQIKRGALLLNTARGSIVSTEALVYALQEGIISGAALDVLEEEGDTKDELNLLVQGHPKRDELATMLRNHLLMKMPNVLITPHLAFDTSEALQRILHTTVLNLKYFIDGRPVNVVRPEVLPSVEGEKGISGHE